MRKHVTSCCVLSTRYAPNSEDLSICSYMQGISLKKFVRSKFDRVLKERARNMGLWPMMSILFALSCHNVCDIRAVASTIQLAHSNLLATGDKGYEPAAVTTIPKVNIRNAVYSGGKRRSVQTVLSWQENARHPSDIKDVCTASSYSRTYSPPHARPANSA